MNQHLRTLSALALVTSFSVLTACDESSSPGEDQIEEAEASFVLTDATDCESAFDGPWLSELADERDWTDEDVAAFCAELADIAETYTDSSTLTTVTVAGVGQLDGEEFETSYFVGAAGYDLDAIREWGEASRSAQAVRRCVRSARTEWQDDESLPEGFVSDCLEEETGLLYPEPIFLETRSSAGIDEVGDAGAGGAFALAIYAVPGEGTVVSFLGGVFYAQAAPAYGAFLGCGAAIGFDADTGESARAALCMAAEYAP